MIDLAGSESSKTETTGLRRKEGSYINKSLLTLGTVGVHYSYYYLQLKRYYAVKGPTEKHIAYALFFEHLTPYYAVHQGSVGLEITFPWYLVPCPFYSENLFH